MKGLNILLTQGKKKRMNVVLRAEGQTVVVMLLGL